MSATAPTDRIPPPPFQPSADTSAPSARPADHVPWYGRVWVLVVGAVLLAVLSFGSGFIAGNAVSLFRVLGGGPGTTSFQDGPGSFDGRLPDGSVPGGPGWRTDEQGDGS